jgi:hypothetical protein
MTIHQCPKCELRFEFTTELDYHCRNDHPQFHHEYPVNGVHHEYDQVEQPEAVVDEPAPAPHPVGRAERLLGRAPERSW